MEHDDEDTILLGKYVIIQRLNYTKLHKFNNISSCATLGNDKVELSGIQGSKYFTTFKMVHKGRGKERLYELEVAKNVTTNLKDDLNIKKSGSDNRNIVNDNKSQKLTTDEITALRDNSTSSADIVETLVTNSTTFSSKTEYSQDKYLKKKQKKYFEYLSIKKPSIRLICEIMYRQDPGKVLGLRPDTLSQALSYSNVSCDGSYLLYDSGTSGLASASMLDIIGANTNGTLIHLHPGNSAQKQALLAMNFPGEQLNRCISVNLYSVLRHYHQDGLASYESESTENEAIGSKRKINDDDSTNKKRKLNDSPTAESNGDRKLPGWVYDNERACVVLRNKTDGLVIVCKEHPMSIFKELLPFINNDRPFVIYHQFQEPLSECYVAMRKMNLINLKLTSSWTRNYQVLKDRTHPGVMMDSNSGFLLSGRTTA